MLYETSLFGSKRLAALLFSEGLSWSLWVGPWVGVSRGECPSSLGVEALVPSGKNAGERWQAGSLVVWGASLGRGVRVVCVLLNSISARGSCHLKAFLYSNQRHPEGKIKKGHGEIFKDEGIRKSWGLFSWVILPPPLPLFKKKKKNLERVAASSFTAVRWVLGPR